MMSRTMTEQARIRSATTDDATRISLVANATFLEAFAGKIDGAALVAHCATAHAADQIASILENGGRAWLAELGGSPIGYALLTAPDLEAAREGDRELKKIYLLSRFHGTGVAKDLFEAAVDGAYGFKRLLLGVKNDNHRAIAFYTKQGFERIGTRQFDVGGTLYDDVVLARGLTPFA